jgi:FKBP-type peptidyl-prolyl cis-trans isomerase FklB
MTRSTQRLLAAALGAGLSAGGWAAGDQPPAPATERDKTSYSLGYQIGTDLKRLGVELREGVATRGIQDGLSGTSPRLTPAELRGTLTQLKRQILTADATDAHRQAQKELDEGRRYLEENAKNEGVVTLPSGLQYKILRPGTGQQPGPKDLVTLHYRASLINGTLFDSSYTEGKPVQVRVEEVMPGWQEGLQLMQEGAQWQLFIPANLGYGERGPLADRAVILEVELLTVQGSGGPDATPQPQGDPK